MSKLFLDLNDPVIFQSFGGTEVWEKVDVSAGTVILKEGEPSQDFYYIFSGAVRVSKALKDGSGQSKQLANLMAGDFFGEGSLLSSQGRSATVEAVANSTLLKLSRPKFETLVPKMPQVAMAILLGIVKVLDLRLFDMNEKLIALQKVGRLAAQMGSQPEQVVLAIFKEMAPVLHHQGFAFFGMDGLPKVLSEGIAQERLDAFSLHIPDYASRLQMPEAPEALVQEGQVYCAVRSLSGQMVGVLAAELEPEFIDQDLRLLVTVSEQIGHLFT